MFSRRPRPADSRPRLVCPDYAQLDTPPWYWAFPPGPMYPATDPRLLWRAITPQVRSVCQMVGMSEEADRQLLHPLIFRYLSMVHLLPASQDHHHSYPAGLLRHGLEVAHRALVLSTQTIYIAPDATPRQRNELEHRWVIAVLVAALAHDIGKLSSFTIYDVAGLHWPPSTAVLSTWLRENRVNRYVAEWQSHRYAAGHEAKALVHLNQLLPETTRHYLLDVEQGDRAYQAILNYLSHTNSPLSEAISQADHDSVEEDLSRLAIASPVGSSASSRRLQSITTIINDWLSESRARDVVCDGVYVWIPWKTVYADLLPRLRDNKVATDPAGLWHALATSGLAVSPLPYCTVNGDLPLWSVWIETTGTAGHRSNAMALSASLLDLPDRIAGATVRPLKPGEAPEAAENPPEICAPASDSAGESKAGETDEAGEENPAPQWDSLGPIGERVKRLIGQVRSHLLSAELLHRDDSHWWLRFPEGWSVGNPEEDLDQLNEARLLDRAYPSGDQALRQYDGGSWIVFSRAVSEMFPSQPSPPVQQSQPSGRSRGKRRGSPGKAIDPEAVFEQLKSEVANHPEWVTNDGELSYDGKTALCERLGVGQQLLRTLYQRMQKENEQ